MDDNQPPIASPKSVAEDLIEYLRETPGVCAEGNVNRWRWIRFTNGEWQATRYGGKHRLSQYVHGKILDDEAVLNWMLSNPVQIIPCSEAHYWGPTDQTVWENVDGQGVFKDTPRCFYCGQSGKTATLELYETTEQGDCLFCTSCHKSWEDAGEIKSGPLKQPP